MRKALGLTLLLIGASSAMLAQLGPKPVPEIDPGSAGSALALLTGGLLVIRGFLKKK